MPQIKKCVVTIHGINTEGAWQGDVERALRPHFESVAIRYPDYRNLWLTLGAGISHWAVILVLIALAAITILTVIGYSSWIVTGLALATVSGLLVVGVWHAKLRRRAVVERIREMIEDAIQPRLHPRPHIIAHSMGSYLSMSALAGFPTLRLDRVVLVGGVLPRRFDWPGLKRSRAYAFSEIRNEMGESDWVVWLVGRIAAILPEFGDCGRRGFVGDEAWLHSLDGPLGPCADCGRAAERAWLHNVPLGDAYGHSTHFLTASHCQDLWLPYLWGFDPDEVTRFRDMCLDVLLFESDGNWISARQAEQELRRSDWTWTSGGGAPRTLEDFFYSAIADRLAEQGLETGDDQLIERSRQAVRLTCRMIQRARLERDRFPNWIEKVAYWHDPRVAIAAAASLRAGPIP